MMLVVTGGLCMAQSFTDKITREFTFEKKIPDNALIVANINGNITVTGYAGDKILLEVTRTLSAKSEERLATAKSETQLGVVDLADTLILFVEGGCNKFGKQTRNRRHNNQWGYNWNNCNDCRTTYDYKMDFVLKVPFVLHIEVSTVNNGDIKIQDVKGIVNADNINGSVRIANLTREANVSTINGDVDIEYDQNPVKECRFYTLNGDINAYFQKGLAANLSFESFNGEFFTNIDQIESLPTQVQKTTKGDGIKFKVDGNRYKVGKGGALLDFETFNGDVYLKEKTN